MQNLEAFTRSQAQTLLEIAKGQAAGGNTAKRAFERERQLTASERRALEWLEDQFEVDANILRDAGQRLMLMIAEEEWPDLLERLRQPERFAGASYPLLIEEVGKLLRRREDPFPSNSTIRRLADVVGAPRLGAGGYRVFFAWHVLRAAFLALGEGNAEAEVRGLVRFSQLDWTPREAAILLSLPDLDPYLRRRLEERVTQLEARPTSQPHPHQRDVTSSRELLAAARVTYRP